MEPPHMGNGGTRMYLGDVRMGPRQKSHGSGPQLRSFERAALPLEARTRGGAGRAALARRRTGARGALGVPLWTSGFASEGSGASQNHQRPRKRGAATAAAATASAGLGGRPTGARRRRLRVTGAGALQKRRRGGSGLRKSTASGWTCP